MLPDHDSYDVKGAAESIVSFGCFTLCPQVPCSDRAEFLHCPLIGGLQHNLFTDSAQSCINQYWQALWVTCLAYALRDRLEGIHIHKSS